MRVGGESQGDLKDDDWRPVEVPARLIAKLDEIMEFRMGVKRVAVVLADGRVLKPAYISGTSIRKVGPADEPFHRIPFRSEDVVDVLDDLT